MTSLLVIPVTLLTIVPDALARADGGQGSYGETTDPVITNAMFAVILFFVLAPLILSLIQASLDRRKHAKMDAAKRAAASTDPRGGW